MVKITKRAKMITKQMIAKSTYSFEEAATILQNVSSVRFKESIEIAINLGVDPRKSDQVVRGFTILPAGRGTTLRVAVFTQSAHAEAVQAGADIVGMDDLAAQIKAGKINFDVVIASPDAMRIVGQLGQILGPRGLMPNPKVGTVTSKVAEAVKNAKTNQVRFRTDKNGIVHAGIGKINFNISSLKKNAETLLTELKKLKPASSKGVYMKQVTLSSTMGPGLIIDTSSLTI